MIGTNNLHDDTPDEIAQGIKAIVAELRKRLPKTQVLLLGVFPAKPEARLRPRAASRRSTKKSPGSTTGRTSAFSTSARRS